jgi:hypothetical protein
MFVGKSSPWLYCGLSDAKDSSIPDASRRFL